MLNIPVIAIFHVFFKCLVLKKNSVQLLLNSYYCYFHEMFIKGCVSKEVDPSMPLAMEGKIFQVQGIKIIARYDRSSWAHLV